MNDYFIQQVIQIRLDTAQDLTGATSPRILYTKKDGTLGFWVASIQGTELVYTTSITDIDQPGTWMLQAYYVKSGGAEYGSIVYQYFSKPLN